MSQEEQLSTILTEGLDTAPASADTAPGSESQTQENTEAKVEEQLKTQASADAKWFDDLPDDLKADPNITKHSSKEAIAKAYVGAVKLLGTDKVPIPKDENDSEGWERFYKAAGRPDEPDAYQFERPTEMPEGMEWDADAETHFRSLALANGLNQKQFEAIAKVEMERRIEAHKSWLDAQRQYTAERRERITRELGDSLPTYKTNAQAVIKQYGDADLISWLEETKAGDDPRFIKAFGRIGKELMGESRLKTPEKSAEVDGADLDSKISNFRTKFSKALYDKMHPDHDRKTRELSELYERRYGTEAAS